MQVHHLSRRDARRVAVRAQLLTAARPTDLLGLVRHLQYLDLDPTAAVAPNVDLVAWSRLGAAYDPADLTAALLDRRIVEVAGRLRPASDLALFRARMARWPGPYEPGHWRGDLEQWVRDNDAGRRDILARLRESGPLTSRQLPDTCARPWRSTGWTNNQNVVRLLDFMEARGEVAVAGRRGRQREWDLAERVHPDDPVVPLAEAARVRAVRSLRALGLARAHGAGSLVEAPDDLGDVGEPAVVDGVRGSWRVDPELLDGTGFRGRAALLSPLDRLVHDRKRMAELFAFDYQLEMYKPAARRRWGYFALPILYGDRLVGKLDATADRKEGVFRVHAVHEDEPFPARTRAAVDREIEDLARWLLLDLVR